MSPAQLRLVQRIPRYRLAMRILQAVEEVGVGGMTADDARLKVGGLQATVDRVMGELYAIGCLRRVAMRLGKSVYETGKGRFSVYLATHAVRMRPTGKLAAVEKAALTASMQFVRAWPKAKDIGRQQTVVKRLLRHLMRLRAS